MDTPIDAPPCIKLGEPMNHCAKRQFSERILGNIALVGDWGKWRFAGRDLVSPYGHRISPERLSNLLMNEDLAKRSRIIQKKAAPDNILRPDFRRQTSSSTL